MKKLVFVFCILLITNAFAQKNLIVGQKAPEIIITDWVKNVPDDKSLPNKYIVLEFWATWCGPCIGAVPHMNELQAKFKKDDLLFISISDETVEKINRICKRIDFQSIVVTDQTKATQIVFGDGVKGLDAFPMTVLIDNQGIIQWVGEPLKCTEKIMKDFLANKLKGKNVFTTMAKIKEDIEFDKEIDKIKGIKKTEINDFVKNEDALLYIKEENFTLELKKAVDIETSSSIISKNFTSLSFTTISEIYTAVFNLKPYEFVIPKALNKEHFDFMYKIKKTEKPNYEMVKTEILKALKLYENKKEITIEKLEITVLDKTKLEETLETELSSQSETGDKILFSNITICDLVNNLAKTTKANYTFSNIVDKTKYDFVISVKSIQETIKSLESYGLKVERKKDKTLVSEITKL